MAPLARYPSQPMHPGTTIVNLSARTKDAGAQETGDNDVWPQPSIDRFYEPHHWERTLHLIPRKLHLDII